MRPHDEERHFFPLTSLQIGDLQSYLSRLTLFLAPESKKLFILVDNRPWLIDQNTRPAHLWQLMVTKSRLSPFANTRAKRKLKNFGRRLDFLSGSKPRKKDHARKVDLTNGSGSNIIEQKVFTRWYSVIDAVLHQKKLMLPVKKLKGSYLLNKELHHTLYGFIVFEVAWVQVRGINYLNELQTDTSMALESKLMKRWEFDSVEQASSCISLWFSGTFYEHFLLEEYLHSVSSSGDVFYDAQEDFSPFTSSVSNKNFRTENQVPQDKFVYGSPGRTMSCTEGFEHVTSLPYTPPASGPYKRRKIMKSSSMGTEGEEAFGEAYSEIVSSPRPSLSSSSTNSSDSENGSSGLEATSHNDVLILFKFDDHDLPFNLRDIIMSDLRLLTLLEYGLPSWVIFLQSYPVFCQIYRPWMCPLARILYALISIVTVVIGFYDLYKNVPLLKATASRLFGPFFDWIETWEMISRVKYLGTMLFLHNFEKAVKWFLAIALAVKSLLLVMTRPIAEPVMELVELIIPFWNVCLEDVEWLSSIMWILLETSYSAVWGTLQIICWPFWLVISTLWSIVISVIYPIFGALSATLMAPFRLVSAMASFIVMILSYFYSLLLEIWISLSAMFQFASALKATAGSYETSMWRSLWNDLFSQVFRAVRSILYGFVAFCTTCNRHRLSIYNHIQEFLHRLSDARSSSFHRGSSHGLEKHTAQEPVEESGKSRVRCSTRSPEHLTRRFVKSKELVKDDYI